LSDDVFLLGISELNAKLRAREFSSVELTRAVCDRLEKLGPAYNALALSLREDALNKARQVDGELKRGRTRGPLQGIPFGAKDLLSVAGRVTAWGARPYAGQVFDRTATVLRKLDKAGAVLVGKLAMVELAGGGGYRYAAASLTGPGRNPWDKSRWSGGSSSGSGSAVAAGLVTFALGSETWGSITTPSAYCGVTGLRPTYGLVSRNGAMALSWTMDKIGPMCRCVGDCALVLQVISGGDSEDPGSAGKSFFYAPQFVRKLSDIRVGFAPSDIAGLQDPAVRSEFEAAVRILRDTGVQLIETQLPDFPYREVAGTIIAAEGSAVFEPLVSSGGVDQLADAKQIAGLKAGLEIPAHEYLRSMRIRRLVQRALRKLFIDVDVLVAPSRAGVATPVSEPLDRAASSPSQPESKPRGLRDLSAAGNLAGLPALSLPCGFAGGLPLGLCLVARPFNENLLLVLGKQFEARGGFHKRCPPGIGS
jgi:aspartyl-tRNA(Asn)/glutamyl-tRNA(Gln) amidotransferase subunit A